MRMLMSRLHLSLSALPLLVISTLVSAVWQQASISRELLSASASSSSIHHAGLVTSLLHATHYTCHWSGYRYGYSVKQGLLRIRISPLSSRPFVTSSSSHETGPPGWTVNISNPHHFVFSPVTTSKNDDETLAQSSTSSSPQSLGKWYLVHRKTHGWVLFNSQQRVLFRPRVISPYQITIQHPGDPGIIGFIQSIGRPVHMKQNGHHLLHIAPPTSANSRVRYNFNWEDDFIPFEVILTLSFLDLSRFMGSGFTNGEAGAETPAGGAGVPRSLGDMSSSVPSVTAHPSSHPIATLSSAPAKVEISTDIPAIPAKVSRKTKTIRRKQKSDRVEGDEKEEVIKKEDQVDTFVPTPPAPVPRPHSVTQHLDPHDAVGSGSEGRSPSPSLRAWTDDRTALMPQRLSFLPEDKHDITSFSAASRDDAESVSDGSLVYVEAPSSIKSGGAIYPVADSLNNDSEDSPPPRPAPKRFTERGGLLGLIWNSQSVPLMRSNVDRKSRPKAQTDLNINGMNNGVEIAYDDEESAEAVASAAKERQKITHDSVFSRISTWLFSTPSPSSLSTPVFVGSDSGIGAGDVDTVVNSSAVMAITAAPTDNSALDATPV